MDISGVEMGFLDKFKKQKNAENSSVEKSVEKKEKVDKKSALDLENEKYIDRKSNTIKIRGHNPFVPSGIIPVAKEVLDDDSPLEFSRMFSIRTRKEIPDAEKAHRFARMYAENIPFFFKAGNIIASAVIVLMLALWVHENFKTSSKVYITLSDGEVREIQTYVDSDDAVQASLKLSQIAQANKEEPKTSNKDVPIIMFDKNLTTPSAASNAQVAPMQYQPHSIPSNPVVQQATPAATTPQ